jgi:hypothetical protein
MSRLIQGFSPARPKTMNIGKNARAYLVNEKSGFSCDFGRRIKKRSMAQYNP